jgi:hypothetical protein
MASHTGESARIAATQPFDHVPQWVVLEPGLTRFVNDPIFALP